MRGWPSASSRRMLRDTSTSTGTTASADPFGGRMTIGRNRKRTSVASMITRIATSVTRCARVSGESGRRYSTYAASATAAARRIASHHGSGYAKCITLRFLFARDRLEVRVDLFAILRRRFVVGARGETIFRLLRLQLFRDRRLGLLERRGQLPLEIFPAGEILFERFGAGRRHRHPAPLEGETGAALRV